MKKLISIGLLAVAVMSVVLSACGNKSKAVDVENVEKLPLNISVYLDLSDRLTRDLTPSQMERDTAVINHLIDLFIEDCLKNGKIVKSKNHFQVFFYPAPQNSEIALLARGLNIDLSKSEVGKKKGLLKNMKAQFQTNLEQIYNDAIQEQKWVGCDIWGFFSNKTVDNLCVREGYRNILVILTDGYLYHAENKVVDGNSYSYVLPQTLELKNSSLIVKRKDLSNLEVLMLEVNPYSPKQHDALIAILEKWFIGMGVEKFVVSETSLPVNTAVYIDNFVNN